MNYLSIVIALLLSVATTLAQSRQGDRRQFSPEEWRLQLEAYLLKETDLTKEEGQKVFPIVHDMHEEQRKITIRNHEAIKKTKQSNLSECEYKCIVQSVCHNEVEQKKVAETYLNKMATVVSWKKVYQIGAALYRFRMEALSQLKPRQNDKDKKK